jgi:hypothetical protein
MVLALIILLVLSSIGLSVGQVMVAKYASVKRSTYITSAVMVTEAGLSDTISRLTSDTNFTGYPDNARKQFFNNTDQGKGEYSSTVTSPTPATREITVNGYIYKDPASTSNEVKKTIKATIKAQVNPTQYSVFTGSGGLKIGPGVVIQGGNIYIQGKVDVSLVAGIGTNSNPINLKVGNIGCRAGGAGSEYPVLCPASSQPISLAGFLSSIYGTVCATGQTSSSNIYPGSTGQGLIPNCVAPFGSMPVFDKQAFVNSMTTPAQQASNANCDGPGNSVNWNAGTIFNGNVSFAAVCKVTLKGDVYIKGNLTSNLFIDFIVDENVSKPPVIVVNGNVAINHSRVNANSAGVPMRIISFGSTNSACTASDSCSVLPSYDDIYNSTSTQTATCQGLPHGDMPGLILQSYFGKVTIDDGCRVGSVAGQTVDFEFFSGTSMVGQLSLDGTVTYDGWKIVDYQQIY